MGVLVIGETDSSKRSFVMMNLPILYSSTSGSKGQISSVVRGLHATAAVTEAKKGGTAKGAVLHIEESRQDE